MSNNNTIDNKIDSDVELLKNKFPWITIIEDEFNDLNNKATHNGSKVLSSILNLKK